ncbi:MAG: bifunctional phosphopantothenoylcysteine decarboxylase/phosphopantothenate--cysteine ligase CoaBC, partial [Acidimicrobiales bacterium]
MTWTPSPMPSATPKTQAPRIVLGVAGGIAAYKSVELLRLLRERGYHVAPVLTPDATRFVGTETFSALASEPARTSLYGDSTTPIPHTYLGQYADVVVVAPATAHLIARYAIGLSDDLLTATLLATRAPVLLCPAMHTEMWEQPSVQENLATLRRRGVLVLEPEVGALAGGDEGTGRLPDPAKVAELVERILEGYHGELSGKSVVISAGGTREAIDPVRVVTNRSSGRQGYALAEAAARMGARVTLVTTVERDLALDTRRAIDVVHVESAEQMREAILARSAASDCVIMAAAVADFTLTPSPEKLKRRDGPPALHFEPAPDILADLVAGRHQGQVIVGFAAETSDVARNAAAKWQKKNVDLLVVHD